MDFGLFRYGLRSLRSFRVWRNIALAGIASVLASEVITLAGMWLMVDFSTMAEVDIRDTWTTAIALSALVPAIIAPVVAWVYQIVIHELEETQAELGRVARSDFLTGLLNRHGFYEAAGAVIEAAQRDGKPVATLVLDIDHFKSINDTHGHDCGDKAICHVADLVRLNVSEGVAARIGGEEFAVVLSGMPIREVLGVAENMRVACEKAPLLFEGKTISMTVSIGTAIDSHRDVELGRLLKRADIALYRAKETGRNRVANAA